MTGPFDLFQDHNFDSTPEQKVRFYNLFIRNRIKGLDDEKKKLSFDLSVIGALKDSIINTVISLTLAAVVFVLNKMNTTPLNPIEISTYSMAFLTAMRLPLASSRASRLKHLKTR